MGSRHFLCWLEHWPSSKGLGSHQAWRRHFYTHHNTGPDAKAGRAQHQNCSDSEERRATTSSAPSSSLQGGVYLCFLFLKTKGAFIIHLFLTKELIMFTSKFGKRTKKIKSTHFILRRETVTNFLQNVIKWKMLFYIGLSSPKNISEEFTHVS